MSGAILRRRARPSSSRRSASDKAIATATLPTSHPSNPTDEHILTNFSIRTLARFIHAGSDVVEADVA